ncbi:MAG: FkbM family methyltransferase [Candidatus Riflebacteria bacterium]|nr:FkbM family methyltransferase [Candidatus Riflebacteria bacterium]
MAGLLQRIRGKGLQVLCRLLFAVRRRDDLVRLGSEHGGWTVPASVLEAGAICYCAGAGEDLSFDLALTDRFACRVLVIDPTPRAVRHFEKIAGAVHGLTLVPFGLWNRDETTRFYAPRDPRHVSHSIPNLQGTDRYFEAPCRRLTTLMREFGHRSLDLLKLDIEGSEHAVIEDMLDAGVRPTILLVEFDQPAPTLKTVALVRELERQGYGLVNIERWNFSFLLATGRPAV